VRLLHRYPRTRHVEGSYLPSGDDEADVLSFSHFAGQRIVVTEKVDGANAAISFTSEGRLLLQSRNRFLEQDHITVGQYAGLHAWAQGVEDELFRVLGSRFVMYGEWVKKKQSVFYDALPQAFLELDVLDTHTEQFLSVQRRRALLSTLPIASVPILAEGVFQSMGELLVFLGPSRFKTPQWKNHLWGAIADACVSDPDRFMRETDPSDDMEGLYLKVERAGVVQQRAKLVRHGARSDYMHASVSVLRDRPVENVIS
jgi:RNA ligase